jgi:hypothetical protein
MRRLVIMLGLVMLLATVAAGVAIAQTKRCNDIPCFGTENEDVLYERRGTVKDAIYALGDHDVISANDFNFDRDRLFGDGGRDKLLTNDGDGRDVAKGGKGRDRCFVDPGDRVVNCEVVHRRMTASETGTLGELVE